MTPLGAYPSTLVRSFAPYTLRLGLFTHTVSFLGTFFNVLLELDEEYMAARCFHCVPIPEQSQANQ